MSVCPHFDGGTPISLMGSTPSFPKGVPPSFPTVSTPSFPMGAFHPSRWGGGGQVRMGKGGYPDLERGTPIQTWDGGTINPVQTWEEVQPTQTWEWGTPYPGQVPGQGVSTPIQNSIACTCYAAGGMPLAFTQEGFLVSIFIFIFNT